MVLCCYNKVGKLFMFILLLWSSTSIIHVKGVSDSLKAGDILNLNGTSRINSKQGIYSLRFWKTFVNGGAYLIIDAVPSKRLKKVWIFDRNQPIDLNSALLSLSHSGVLKIESNGKTIILYSPPQPINNTLATLLDTGNFVLQQIYLHPNGTKSSTMLWQSFDYPTDTLLPTMKLGFNRKTGHKWSLVSWLTTSLPNSGPFSLEWEEHELVIKQRGRVYWKSGKLRNDGLFENIPNDVQSAYQYTIVSNSEEDSFTFKINPTSKKKEKYETILGWTLLQNGRLRSSEGDIARADVCYGYNREKGCQKWDDIHTCRKPGYVFLRKTGNPSTNNKTFNYNASYVYSDCKDICWNNCSCIGFNELYSNETGCRFFFANSSSYDSDGDDDDDNNSHVYILGKSPKLTPSEKSPKLTPSNGKKKRIWISAIIAAGLLIICTPILCQTLKKLKGWLQEKKNKRRENEILDLASSNQASIIKDIEDDLKGHDIKVFNYESILTATMGFSLENKLGEGGYGPVYKGILSTGQEIAVKRLSKASGQGVVEFKNELTLICELQHTNLVQLLGCCIYEEERILVYECMPNKSLDFYLFDCTRRKLLDWKKRFNIIEGIAQGLLYLHKYSRLKIIHRDLKASNILLDENMNPKISDFGMARMFTQQESMVNTNRIVGTYGYMSPEYVMEGVFSTKSDVYSFGVLLLEIVSGRRNNSFSVEDMPLTLIGYVWELWKEGKCLQLMDEALSDAFISDEVQRCIHVGLLCVEHYASDRPTMSNIISMLTNKNAFVPLPKRPAFYVGRETPKETTTSKLCETYSFRKEISTTSDEE